MAADDEGHDEELLRANACSAAVRREAQHASHHEQGRSRRLGHGVREDFGVSERGDSEAERRVDSGNEFVRHKALDNCARVNSVVHRQIQSIG